MNQLATVSAWGPASAWRVLELAGEAVPASPCRALSNLEKLVRHWRTQNLRPSLHYVLLLPAMDEGDLQTALKIDDADFVGRSGPSGRASARETAHARDK